MLNIAFKLSKP
ncbi:hypothetical protein VTH06DRAFT_1875 [Thermothelomyces fergusii]